jgi:peptidoglycan/LPS O-acetylase OafA/YrhL
MCLHLGLSPSTTEHLPGWVSRTIGSAYYFVIVFFTISGFLIASTSIRRFRALGSIDIGDFIVFRVARIVPFLLLVLVALVSLGNQHAKGFEFAPGVSLYSAAYAALSFQFNYWFLAHTVPETQAWGVMWSLSIEEIFYGLFPILCLLLRSNKAIVFWLLYAIPLALYVRSTDGAGLYLATGCMDAIAVGVMVALISQRPSSDSGVRVTLLAYLGMATGLSLIIFVSQFSHPSKNAAVGPLLCSLGAGLYVFASTRVPAASSLFTWRGRSRLRVLTIPLIVPALFGRASYEAYLLHLPIKLFVVNYLRQTTHTFVLIGIIGAISYGLNSYFTEPLSRMIRELLSPKTKRQVSTAASLRSLVIPGLCAAALLLLPSSVVMTAPREPSVVRSVSLTIYKDDLPDDMEPLIVYGNRANAEFLSVKKSSDGSVEWQFDHWGAPSLTKSLTPRFVGGKSVVLLDCGSPSVYVDGKVLFTGADMPGFSKHGEVYLGSNDVGGSTMARAYSGRIKDVSIELDTGRSSHELSWRSGVLR